MSRVLPILFNTEMVRAILDGRKTVTRRLVKHNVDAMLNSPYHKEHPEVPDKQLIQKLCKLPVEPGDILYIRETYCWCPCWDCGFDTEEHKCICSPSYKFFNDGKAEWGCYGYKASFEDNEYPSVDTWHPSIHMPKEAARIFLKVKDVRVERLQDITEEQAVCEGTKETFPPLAVDEFTDIWNSTIKKADLDKYGWDANPWVWVIEFERCEKPEGE